MRFCRLSLRSLRSWRDFARESFCFGSEAVNESGEAVRGLVKSPWNFTRGFAAREIPRGLYGGSAAARSPAHESRQLRRLFSTLRRCSRNLSPSRLPVSPMYNFLQRVQVIQ